MNGGSVAVQPMSGFGDGWSGNAQLFWGGAAPGSTLDLTIDIGEEGIYEVELHLTRAPDFGRMRFQVDGNNSAEVFDGYAPTVAPSGPVTLGTFALQPGARTLRFVVFNKNPDSSNYFAGIDFVRLTRLPTAAGQTQSGLGTAANWRITALSVLPQPTESGSGGEKAYKDGQEITVKCAYEPIVTNQWPAKIVIRIRNAPANPIVVKHQASVTKAGEIKTSFKVFTGAGTNHIGCGVGTTEDGTSWNYVDEKIISVQVVSPKWPTAPIIEEPVTGGKLVIKPYNPSSSHCADGGFILFEWQFLDKGFKTYEPFTWKPLNAAFEARDEERLRDLLNQWESSPESVKGEGIAVDLVRVIRKIALVEQRLKTIETEIQSLEASDLYKLRSKVEDAEDEGRDLLCEMESQVTNQIDEAKGRLERILQTRLAV